MLIFSLFRSFINAFTYGFWIYLIDVAVDIFDLGKSLYKHFVETWGNKMFFQAEIVEKGESLDGQWNGMRREFE
jgi:hypothetical protein